MDFSQGKNALLQALAIMNTSDKKDKLSTNFVYRLRGIKDSQQNEYLCDEKDASMKISGIMDSLKKDKSCTVSLFCEALALQKQELEQKKKCSELLEEVAKWWKLLVDDREKLLLTVSALEMEKDAIIKKYTDPAVIYGHLEKKRKFEISKVSSCKMKESDFK